MFCQEKMESDYIIISTNVSDTIVPADSFSYFI